MNQLLPARVVTIGRGHQLALATQFRDEGPRLPGFPGNRNLACRRQALTGIRCVHVVPNTILVPPKIPGLIVTRLRSSASFMASIRLGADSTPAFCGAHPMPSSA